MSEHTIESLNIKIKELEDQNEILQKALHNSDIPSMRKEIDGLRTSYNDCESRLNTTLDKTRWLKDRNTRLEEKLKEKTEDFKEALEENAGLAKQIDDLTGNLTTADIENSKLRNEVEDLKKDSSDLEFAGHAMSVLSTKVTRYEKIIDRILAEPKK